MAIVRTDEQHYHDIADAIREKTGDTADLLPEEMAPALQAATLEELRVTPTESPQTFEPTSPCIGYNRVVVGAAAGALDAAEEMSFGRDYERVPSGTMQIGDFNLPAIPSCPHVSAYPYLCITRQYIPEGQGWSLLVGEGPCYLFCLYASPLPLRIPYDDVLFDADLGVYRIYNTNGQTKGLYYPGGEKPNITYHVYYCEQPNGDGPFVPLPSMFADPTQLSMHREGSSDKMWANWTRYYYWPDLGRNSGDVVWMNHKLYPDGYAPGEHDQADPDYYLVDYAPANYAEDPGYVEVNDSYKVQGDTMNELLAGAQNVAGTEEPMTPEAAAETLNSYEPPTMQEKTISPSAEAQEILPDEGYDGLSKVTVAAAPLEEITVAHEAAETNDLSTPEYQVIEPTEGQYGIGKVNVPKLKLAYLIEAKASADKEKTFTIKTPDGYDGIGTASVTVTYTGGGATLQEKTVTPTTAAQVITADEGYEGLRIVNVAAAPTETLRVTPTTAEQTFTPSDGKVGFSQVTVAAAEGGGGGNYQEKTVTPTTEEQVITADDGYDALSKVTVRAAEGGGGEELQSVMEVSF